MNIKQTAGEKVFDGVNGIIMVFMMVITLYPFIYVISASFSNSNLLVGHNGFLLLPKDFSTYAYQMVFKNPSILTGYGNTIFILTVGTAINLLMTSLGAYVLSRKNFAIKRIMMMAIVFTMYFHGGLIPRYLLINNTLHLKNNLMALILPTAIITYNLIVMRTSFMAIPDGLEESAKMDGANDFVILFRIILPVSMPVVAVMILFYGVHHWNAWFDALLFIRNRKMYPLQLILREILVISSTESMMTESHGQDKAALGEAIKYATIIVATVPILVVYPFAQKYFVKGVMVGALKG